MIKSKQPKYATNDEAVAANKSIILYTKNNYEIEGGRLEYDDYKTDLKIKLKYIFTIIFALLAVTLFINLFHVVLLAQQHVTRQRDTASAELRQDCCQIFKKLVDATVFPSERISDCHRILQEDKKRAGKNRCEMAEDVLAQYYTYAVVMEVCNHYFPFMKFPFYEYLSSVSMGTIGSLLGSLLLKGLV